MSIYKATKLPHKIKTPTIVDLGANCGLESKKLYDIYGPDAHVILVEPCLENVNLIYQNMEKWGVTNNFFVEHCAIDTTSTFKEFGFHQSIGMQGRLNGSLDEFNWKQWNYEGTRTVRTKQISQICATPNIVKVDIERHEYVILPEVAKMESIQVMYVELHGPCYPLDIVNFLNKTLEGTKLKVTGWFIHIQPQTEEIGTFTEIEPQPFIDCGDDKYVIIEKVE
nr:FkbM family methyltransferase [Pseudomonadota bacterium]